MERVWLDRHTFLVACPPEHHLRKERSSAPSKLPKQMLFPRQFRKERHGVCEIQRSCYSPLWPLRVTGNCFWFLDRPPVSKGLVCSPSLHLLLAFFLVVRRLALQLLYFQRSFFLTGSVYGFLAIRLIRVDCWISKLFTRQTLEIPTDQPTNMTNRKSAKKLSDFRKSLHVQSRSSFS